MLLEQTKRPEAWSDLIIMVPRFSPLSRRPQAKECPLPTLVLCDERWRPRHWRAALRPRHHAHFLAAAQPCSALRFYP